MKRLFAFFLVQSFLFHSNAQLAVTNVQCEHLTEPIGLDVLKPRFTWQLQSNARNVLQTAYEIKVSDQSSMKSAIWATGKINSDQSVMVPYGGPALASGKKYFWQVRVWDNQAHASPWSAVATWRMALLKAADWNAKWIAPGYVEDTVNRPSPLLRKQFSCAKKIKSAIAYISSHGLYQASLNGKRAGDAYLTPGWTSYNKRLQYQVYDVTNLLQQGNNAIGVTLGNGWYRGVIGFSNNRNVYGRNIALLLQLDIEFTDGTIQQVISDESWKSSTGSIRYAEIYNGETIDAREEKKGWENANYDDSKWWGVQVMPFTKDVLLATYNEPVKKHEIFHPRRIFMTPAGEHVIDFGQNLVGWVMVKVKGNAGDTISIQHAEVLDKYGDFYTENLRAAKATDYYILNGEGEETFEPHFTFHGFRYIKVSGYKRDIGPENFTAVALYSDMEPTGSFACSEPLLNQLQHNIQWGQKGNFLDVPTDCPQRDERLGWTGDAQVFSRTASFNMQVNNFFAKWLKDLAADQGANGAIPFVIPNILGQPIGSTGWADAGTIIPWNMYLAYGDKRILEEQYPSMKAWVSYMEKSSKNYLWNTGFHFGDWLFYSLDNDNIGRSAITDKYLIAQCFFAYSTQILIRTATVLGKADDVKYYTDLLQKVKDAFMHEYVTANGRLVSSTQTAYVLALNFDMLPESMRAEAVDRLVQNIRDYNDHLTTGFLGTPYLCHVLSRFGKTDVAYKLLLQQTYPSWLYPVKMGATTIWERWNGIRPDSSFASATMNSFNHYAYGAIGDWMYRVMAGLDTYTDGPGYKHIRIEPHIGGGLTMAAAHLETYYGKLSSRWKVENGQVNYEIEIPANTTADIFLPAADGTNIQEGGKTLGGQNDIKVGTPENGVVKISVGSGKYSFVLKQ
jgi:alpha-L-rhamnosidase